jgi:thiamine pyrophosphate-dependent acetolactate synthase large subunit-like protein
VILKTPIIRADAGSARTMFPSWLLRAHPGTLRRAVCGSAITMNGFPVIVAGGSVAAAQAGEKLAQLADMSGAVATATT